MKRWHSTSPALVEKAINSYTGKNPLVLSSRKAIAKLPEQEQRVILAAAATLQDDFDKLGPLGGIEVIASLARLAARMEES